MSGLSERKTPPETDEEHRYIWTAADRAHLLWSVFGPVALVIQNWRWWAAAGAFTLWLYRTDLAAAVAILAGVGQ